MRRPAMQFESAEPEYVPAQLATNDAMREEDAGQ